MVLVLGTWALLHGSWTVYDTKPVKIKLRAKN